MQRHDLVFGKGLSGHQFAGRMHLGAGRMIDDDELRLVKVENFAKLFSNLNYVASVARSEGGFIPDADILERIGIDEARVRDAQPDGRSAQQISDEAEALPVPRIKIRAGAGGPLELFQHDGMASLDFDLVVVDHGIEPAHADGIDRRMFADANLDGEPLHGSSDAQIARGDFQPHAQSAGVGAASEQLQLELVIGIAAVVAKELQAAAFERQNQIRVAIAIKVCGCEELHLAARRRLREQRGRQVAKTVIAEIAPDAQSVACGHDVEPAVIVVVEEQQSGGAEIAGDQ